MTDRPIIFSGPMILALLDGRKTETRRVLKPQIKILDGEVPAFSWGKHSGLYPDDWFGYGNEIDRDLPYAPGDRLWVREALHQDADAGIVHYSADGAQLFGASDHAESWKRTSRPAMHMPRWASRLILTVTNVRVQKLQEISEPDAVAEGVEKDSDGWRDYQMPATQCCTDPRNSFRTLWDNLNAARGFGWSENPWVVAVSFSVSKQNIDGDQP